MFFNQKFDMSHLLQAGLGIESKLKKKTLTFCDPRNGRLLLEDILDDEKLKKRLAQPHL